MATSKINKRQFIERVMAVKAAAEPLHSPLAHFFNHYPDYCSDQRETAVRNVWNLVKMDLKILLLMEKLFLNNNK